MTERNLFELCETYGQNHLIDHVIRLPVEKRSIFMKNLRNVDFPSLHFLYSQFKLGNTQTVSLSEIEPPEVICWPRTDEEKRRQNEAKMLGEGLLREKKVACLLVAGGQATRLGISSPKGFLPITPVKRKTFFQLFSEKILALSRKYNTEIPFLIMTNPESRVEVEDFFESNHFFGLKKENTIIFEQEMLPVLNREGKIIIKNETEILLSPNGHGNCIKRIHDLGILHMLDEHGYRYLFYFQVDNPLVKIADPVFLGYHMMYGADVSLKVVRKKREDEKVGLYLTVSGRPALIEYLDLSPEIASLRGKDGNLLYWAGNTAMHVFSVDFLKRLNAEGTSFPYHVTERKAYLEKEGKEIEVLKFETFVFDCLRWAEKVCAMEILREEEFSPVKNREGHSSPDTARKDMSNLFKRWLALCGINVPDEVWVEISPLFALDPDECKEKIKGRKLDRKKEIYIE